jgi:hypothetical protein
MPLIDISRPIESGMIVKQIDGAPSRAILRC